jgi:hypothetical protein
MTISLLVEAAAAEMDMTTAAEAAAEVEWSARVPTRLPQAQSLQLPSA